MFEKPIFMIGPASVGKTTVGALLSEKLGYHFVDVDREFCERIKLIPDYIKEFGYAGYCEANSKLADQLFIENPARTVFATPSGFLAHEDSPHLVEKHLKLIKNGISILLLPHPNHIKGAKIIVACQLSRWDDLRDCAESDKNKFLDRFEKYKNYGDIQIYSMEKPKTIVERILDKLSTQV